MPDTGSIVDGAASFLTWFDSTSWGSSLSGILGGTEVKPSESPWLSRSEKERIDDLLLSGSLMIVPPQINLATFQDIALNLPDYFRIGTVSNEGLGALESAMVLTAVGAWAAAQLPGGGLIQALQGGFGQNPLELTLQQYLSNSSIRPPQNLSMYQSLRSAHLLQAAMRTVQPDTILKAFRLAEQQLIIAVLDKWNELTALSAERQRAEMKRFEIIEQELAKKLLRDYLKKVEESQEAITQPILSILVGAVTMDTALMASLTSCIPGLATTVITGPALAVLQSELAVIATGVLTTVLTWAIPTAMTLSPFAQGVNNAQRERDAASAYALAMASIVTNPKVAQYIHSRLEEAVQKGLIKEADAETMSSAFHISLLLTAIALVYRAETGGLTAGELKAVANGEMSLSSNELLALLTKLVKEQLSRLDPKIQEKLLEELTLPYDQDPSLNSLIDPIKAFVMLWDPKYFRESNLAKPG